MNDQAKKAIRKVAERVISNFGAATTGEADKLARAVLLLIKER